MLPLPPVSSPRLAGTVNEKSGGTTATIKAVDAL
jgi:hypothetical protein